MFRRVSDTQSDSKFKEQTPDDNFSSCGDSCSGHANNNNTSKIGILIYSSVSISLVNVIMPLRERSGLNL